MSIIIYTIRIMCKVRKFKSTQKSYLKYYMPTVVCTHMHYRWLWEERARHA